jgi:hypothetical protein
LGGGGWGGETVGEGSAGGGEEGWWDWRGGVIGARFSSHAGSFWDEVVERGWEEIFFSIGFGRVVVGGVVVGVLIWMGIAEWRG